VSLSTARADPAAPGGHRRGATAGPETPFRPFPAGPRVNIMGPLTPWEDPMIRLSMFSLAALCAAFPLLGCASTGSVEAGGETTATDGDEASEEHEQHEREMAELALEIAQLDVQIDTDAARLAVQKARSKLDEARLALEHFESVQKARKLTEAQLELDRAGYRAEEAEAELAELEAMYEAEEFAATTKELVIRRGRVQRDFARRALELSEQELEILANVELPKELRKLQNAVRDAEAELAEAEGKLEKVEVESEKKVLEARHALAKLVEDEEDDE